MNSRDGRWATPHIGGWGERSRKGREEAERQANAEGARGGEKRAEGGALQQPLGLGRPTAAVEGE